MAVVLPKKTRKVSVRKNRVKDPSNDKPKVCCRICGNENEKQISQFFRPADGMLDSELVKGPVCTNIVTCANMVSLLERNK